ncbi:MAG: hypothetical protein ACAI35_27955 [Candidatus Methylacidiphilales bacterium]|nr:hypothetical protein [Candidatus Methylacidiphilales bacterium]
MTLTAFGLTTPLPLSAQLPSRADMPEGGASTNAANRELGTTPALPADPNSPEEAQDIRDIRGVISIPYGWLWAMYVLGVLILITLGYEGWRLYDWYVHKRKRPAHEIALEALEKARELMRPDTVEEFSVAVSGAVRTYIEARFGLLGLVAARRTTEEFLQKVLTLKNSPVAMHASGLEEFLRTCDLVKFACQNLTIREMEDMLSSARNFVNDTKVMPNLPEKPKADPTALPKFGEAGEHAIRPTGDRSRGDEAYMPPGSFESTTPAQAHQQQQQLQAQLHSLPPSASASPAGPTFSTDTPRS